MSKKTSDETTDIATAELVQTLLEQINVMNKRITVIDKKLAAMNIKTKTVATHCGYSMPELDIDIE
jgi:hypothetical protein